MPDHGCEEVTIDELRRTTVRMARISTCIDVREDHEWEAGRIPGSRHLGRGIIERDIEGLVPDYAAEIVLYCGGGYRSALAADNLQKMGYQNVISMAGGIRAWREAGLEETVE
jgi:rhodanese-related sulfurtransferase